MENMLDKYRLILDAYSRIGDKVTSLILSGELVIEDSYINSQIEFIQKIMEDIKND